MTRRVPLSEVPEGTWFLYDSSWGLKLAKVQSFFRADRVWFVTEDGNTDWMYTSVEVEVD